MVPEWTPDHTVELTAALVAHRRKLEALSAANHAALDHAQAVAAANLAAMHQAVAELEERLLDLEASQAEQVRAARQVALFKAGLERAVGNMEQLRGLIHQAQASARMVLSQRVCDAMNEAEAVVASARH